MFELDHELAQDIVDRAMAILPYNVNVMDSQGLILGSGERQRVDTRHEGAQLVLANGRTVEIDEQAALCLKGVQPGVNLPLLLDQRLIGVLGITGAPDQVRTFAELVRMTAEMLLGQRQQRADQHWRQQRGDELLGQLFSDAEPPQRLLDEARQLGLKPQLARTPWLFETGEGPAADGLAQWLLGRYPGGWCHRPAAGSLLWCRPQGQASDDANLPARLAEAGFTVQRIAAGSPCDNLAALRRGYRQLRDLLAYGRDILPDTLRLDLAGLRLPSLLWRHRLEDGLEPWLVPLQGVIAHDANGQLLNTLRAWCEHDGQSQRCADALGIHRNSLRYRMERIAELSGLDPSTLEGMLTLYLGVRLWPCNDAQ